MSLIQRIKTLIAEEAGESSSRDEDLGAWLEALEEVKDFIDETVESVKDEL